LAKLSLIIPLIRVARKNDRASDSRTEVIIREICSQLVGQERCEHVVYAV
jgi:hypothetical protein